MKRPLLAAMRFGFSCACAWAAVATVVFYAVGDLQTAAILFVMLCLFGALRAAFGDLG